MAPEEGAVQRKGPWSSHLFCTAVVEDQKDEERSRFCVRKQELTESELT